MPCGGDCVTLAEWLRVPGLRRTDLQRGGDPQAVPMQRLPPSDLANRGHDLRLDAPACRCGCGSAPCII